MRVMIHACPKRLWYVEEFLAPSIRAQGIDPIIYNDIDELGNLWSFVDSLKFCTGGGTWHLQDDVIICRDFVTRAAQIKGVANAFCHINSKDDPLKVGPVYPPDLWNGFPCVHIPDDYAHEFAAWLTEAKHTSWQDIMIRMGHGDDYLFHEFFETVHGTEMGYNVGPNLVDHIDWLIGGSVVNEWRGYICRSDLWEDEALVDELKERIKNR